MVPFCARKVLRDIFLGSETREEPYFWPIRVVSRILLVVFNDADAFCKEAGAALLLVPMVLEMGGGTEQVGGVAGKVLPNPLFEKTGEPFWSRAEAPKFSPY
jgi:hypothetical protein